MGRHCVQRSREQWIDYLLITIERRARDNEMLHSIWCAVQYIIRDSITDQCGTHHLCLCQWMTLLMKECKCSFVVLVRFAHRDQHLFLLYIDAGDFIKQQSFSRGILSFQELSDQPIHLSYWLWVYTLSLPCKSKVWHHVTHSSNRRFSPT